MLMRFFATGEDRPLLKNPERIDRLYRRGRVSMMLAITVGYGLAYTCRLPLSVVKKPLIDNGIFSPEQLGLIGSALLYAYSLGKLTNGFLADHANVKRFFSAGLMISALINLAVGGGAAVSLGLWVALWALNGWFQGFGAPSSAVVLSNWFSNRERGSYYGIWSTAHAVGEGLTFYVTAAVVGLLGWRAGFWGPGILCVLVALGLYLSLRDRPQTLGLPPISEWKKDYGEPIQPANKDSQTRGKAQILVLRSPAIWIMGLSNAMLYVTRYGINNWGILYLQETRGYSLAAAGLFLTVNTIAGIAGSVAYGFISDRLFDARRPPVNLIFGLLEVGSLLVIFFLPPGHPVVLSSAFALYGFAMSGILASLGGLFAIDIAPKQAAGAAMGFMGVFGYLGAAIQDQISGYLIGNASTMVDGVRQYDFTQPVIFWIGTSVISVVIASFLWRVKPKD
jgi:OPA family sugar phosphate sensor protein UhpC-like MFS transporter